jgi:hypothetical protein
MGEHRTANGPREAGRSGCLHAVRAALSFVVLNTTMEEILAYRV